MRVNLTKKDIINSIYMQLGFSKRILEVILEDILKNNKINSNNKFSNWKKQKKTFLKLINLNNIFHLKKEHDIENFLKTSIEFRELSKFYFTKYVNKILELIKEISTLRNNIFYFNFLNHIINLK